MLSSLAFALFVRIDNFIVVALMILFRRAVFSVSSNAHTDHIVAPARLSVSQKIVSAVFLSVSFAVWVVYTVVCLSSSAQVAHISKFGNNLGVNLNGNIEFFLNNTAFPLPVTIAACIAIVLAARGKMKTGFQNIIYFNALWFFFVFLGHLSSAAGGYDIHLFKDTCRYTVNLLPPLIILAAIGVTRVLSILSGNFFKSATLAIAIAYMLFVVPIFSDFINTKSHFTRINEAVLETINKYPLDVTFVTNSDLVFNILSLDAGRQVSFTEYPAEADSFCVKDKECVFILYRFGMMRELDSINLSCMDRILVKNVSILFLPIKEIVKVSTSFLQSSDPTPLTGFQK